MALYNPKVSICIPVYEMHGSGVKFLSDLLSSIKKQSYGNLEIVISDHSKNDDIENFVRSVLDIFIKRRTQVLYYRLRENHGNSSANMNNAIIHASGEIIKPMFQDDFFCNNECIYEIVKIFADNPSDHWGAIGFIHTDISISNYYNELVPYYNVNIWSGYNTIGCPSVIFFKKDSMLFDEKLIWMMDCMLYFSLYQKFSKPLIINKTAVVIRIWDNSISNVLDDTIKEKEHDYIKKTYKPEVTE